MRNNPDDLANQLIQKIKEWLSENIRECPDTEENISLIEDNKNLLKFIKKWEKENV